jgi:hypothetical protein
VFALVTYHLAHPAQDLVMTLSKLKQDYGLQATTFIDQALCTALCQSTPQALPCNEQVQWFATYPSVLSISATNKMLSHAPYEEDPLSNPRDPMHLQNFPPYTFQGLMGILQMMAARARKVRPYMKFQ